MPSKKKKYSSDDDFDNNFEENDDTFDDDISNDEVIDDLTVSDNEKTDTENTEEVDVNNETDEENSDIDEESESESESETEEDDDGEHENEETEEESTKDKKKSNGKDECMYNVIQEDDTNLITDIENNILCVPPEDQCTTKKLTTYERVRILSTRAKQISLGAKPMLKNIGDRTPMELAELELKYKVVPIKIKRPLPNGQYEIVKVSQLEIVN
jgi:DNA-directed RNA polymerase subunit K/omega